MPGDQIYDDYIDSYSDTMTTKLKTIWEDINELDVQFKSKEHSRTLKN